MYISASSFALAERSKRAAVVTVREQEVLEFVARRLSNKDVSARLGISESTVKFHLTHIYAKLGVTDRRALEDRVRHEEQAHDLHLSQGLDQARDGEEAGWVSVSPLGGGPGILERGAKLKEGSIGPAGAEVNRVPPPRRIR